MTGDDRVRFCDSCQLNVYNFAELTRKEAEEIIRTTEGRICGRLYRRADGSVITKDCPVGLRAVRRRVARIAGAVFATLMSMCSVIVGQKQSQQDKSCRQQVKITSKLEQLPNGSGKVTGTIVDPNGAVVAGAKIAIVDRQTNSKHSTKSNDEGVFTQNLSPGTYDILIESPGFKPLKIAELKVRAGANTIVDATLLVASEWVTVGILIGDTPLIDTSSSEIKTVIDAKTIQSLPKP